ncbi:MAG: hypothetical protein KKE59_04760, partial [Proteobacteria bacterium]|nr:hypothetical protein [Pseudomonadota bacterium]
MYLPYAKQTNPKVNTGLTEENGKTQSAPILLIFLFDGPHSLFRQGILTMRNPKVLYPSLGVKSFLKYVR